MDNKTRLRETHPNLFYSMLVWACFTTVVALTLVFNAEDKLIPVVLLKEQPSIPLELWGVAYSITAGLLLFGITNGHKRYRYARWGMVIGSYIGAFWALGFWTAFLFQSSISLHPPMLWTIYTLKFVIWSREPTFNPISAVINTKGTSNDMEYRP